MAEAFAPAKVNLTLHVTGRRPDGYHELDSLVMFADVGDTVRSGPGKGLTLTVEGDMAAGVPVDGRNLIIRAARLAGVEDAALHLQKELPPASGIGGGSSDAAACLRALQRSHGAKIPPDLASLGADLPVCMVARTARMQGIGDAVTPLEGVPRIVAVLANPGVAVPTPAVFAALERRDGAPMGHIPTFSGPGDFVGWLALQRNDLEQPACCCAPQITEVLAALRANGARLARMSGSGATCFGIFEGIEPAREAAKALGRAGWWVRATQMGGKP
ncbi:MAG: 4-(cytidine 5'-diphospho)-2-C-methyl-D-erythritol kinase [Rhodobacteraceae bacterium]|nr:4-(cytidine 5'-diphospho)-2-C-methyl-D-erythritol kinase [Paracoccaceae bacterium]